ncbi:MAG: DUF2312 domain-containing protein [Methanobrevibacter sp.]|nr:DUF2312 domain-containing protein [Methanobrevibacter sp.]
MNQQIDPGQLQLLVERIENLEQDAKQVAEDIKEVYSQAKAQGYDPKYIKQCIKLRAKDPDQLEEEDELLQMYRKALNI